MAAAKSKRTQSRHTKASRERSKTKVRTISGRLNMSQWNEFDRLCKKYKITKHAVITTSVKNWVNQQKKIEKA